MHGVELTFRGFVYRAGEVLESEEEEEEQPALENKSLISTSKEDKSIIPITPDKRVVPRPPRKPVTRKRAMPIGAGRGRGRRGSKEEEPDEQHAEQDRAVSKRIRGKNQGENPIGGSAPSVESPHVDEAVGDGKRRVLRSSGRGRKVGFTPPDNDEYVPKRRLVLDEGEIYSSSQDSDRVPTAAEPSRPRMSTRLAHKRKAQERYGLSIVGIIIRIPSL